MQPGLPSYGLDLGSDPAILWGRPLLYPLLGNPTQAFLLLSRRRGKPRDITEREHLLTLLVGALQRW